MKQNYWTKIGLEAKKTLQAQKIFDAKKHHFRHPKLSDLTFEEKTTSLTILSREERRKKFEEERKNRIEKLKSIPYSELHNKLVNELYGNKVDAFKKNALIAAHEEAIRKIQIKRSIYRSMKAIDANKDKPNIVVINKAYGFGNISTFMTIPSSHDLDTLRRIGIEMSDKLSVSMKEFFNIEIWEKSEYMKRMAGDHLANYRYEIGKNKKLAA